MDKPDVVFVDVDTQNDFLDYNGSLYIPVSESIRTNLARLIKYAVDNDITLVSTMDSHLENDPEFREFKPHCIPGTWGWKKIPETTYDSFQMIDVEPVDDIKLESNRFIVKKRKIDAFSNPNLMKLIKKLNPEKLIVFGVATDYCVRQLVLGLLKDNFLVELVEDAIKGINEENAESAIKEMLANGVRLVETDEVVKK